MAWWAQTNAELQKSLTGKDQFVEENVLSSEPDAFFGPVANQVKVTFPDLMATIKLTDTPWAKGAENYHGIGVNNTYWVLSPRSLRHGIWILNATSTEAAKNAQAAGAPTQYGYFVKATDTIPPLAALKAAGLVFGAGFSESYYRCYPDQDPRPRQPPPRPVVPVRTFELFAMMNGRPMLLTDVLSKAGPGDYVLADGAELIVGDASEDGFGLAGNPGRWAAFYPGRSPADFGLDPDKAVLRWDGEKGVVLDAALLRDMYGPTWKANIFGGV